MCLGKPYRTMPPTITRVMPLYAIIVARVAMKSGILSMVIIKPFTRPRKVPTARQTTMASIGSMEVCFTSITRATPDNVSVDPTERSIPAPVMTNVMPTASRI